MYDELILVDLYDRPIGRGEKGVVHHEGRLHRAFSVFLWSQEGLLIQQRNLEKYHSGGLWANACCSHPRYGESLTQAVPRRMQEELGMDCPVEELFSFVYRADFQNGVYEYEYDHVFVGEYHGSFSPNEEEIAQLMWIPLHELERQLVEEPHRFAPWFLIAAPRVLLWLQEQER